MGDTEKYLQYCQNTGAKLKPKVLSQLSDNDKKYSAFGILHNLTLGNSSSWVGKHWFKIVIAIGVFYVFRCIGQRIMTAEHTDASISPKGLSVSVDNSSGTKSSISGNAVYINNMTGNLSLPLK